jgi:hypothetical protein
MINIKLVKFLIAICAALSVVLILEWLYALYAQNQLMDSINDLDKQKNNAAELPSIELEKRPETGYVDLVERPLFIQGRKPVKESNETNITPINTATDTFNWDLNGIYTQNNHLYGLFSRNAAKVAKDNYRKITKDGNIDGWQLTEITNDKAVFSLGGKQKELVLRKSKPKNTHNPNTNPMNVPVSPNPAGFTPGNFPNQQQPIAVPEQMPEPVPQPVIDPELIPDDSSESNFENSDEEEQQ